MFNSITLIGNLGRDPELKYTTTGTPICSFSMATNDRKKGKSGDWEQVTTWFRVTVFGRQAETCSQYLVKGKQVCVIGRLRIEDWVDRDGVKRWTAEVTGDKVQFLGGRDDREERQQFDHDASKQATGGDQQQDFAADDDVPF